MERLDTTLSGEISFLILSSPNMRAWLAGPAVHTVERFASLIPSMGHMVELQ